jgi:hypothetical protein
MLRAVFGDSPPPHGEPGFVTVSVEARDGEFELLTTSQKAGVSARALPQKKVFGGRVVTGADDGTDDGTLLGLERR